MSRPLVAILMDDADRLSWTDRRHLFSDSLIDDLRGRYTVRFEPGADLVNDEEARMRLLEGAQACITGWGAPHFTDKIIEACPRLGFIGYAGGSVKAYVCDAIVRRGIAVSSADIINAEDVSQTAIGLILTGIRGLVPRYLESRGERLSAYPSRGISGKTVGIVGAGLIGRKVMSFVRGLDVRLLVADPFLNEAEAAHLGAELVSLDELGERSDVISIHVPSLPETRGMFDRRFFASMKDDAILINTALGDLIDQRALAQRLSESRIFAYADVIDPDQDETILTRASFAYSPAVAGCLRDTQYRMGEFVVAEMDRFFAGEPLVNRFDFSKMAIRA